MDPVIAEQFGRDHPLARHLDDFLTDQKNANASKHTLRAYRSDLLQFTAHCDGELADLTADPIRAFLADIGDDRDTCETGHGLMLMRPAGA